MSLRCPGILALPLLLTLACGGGGGGGAASGLSFSPSPLTVQAIQGFETPFTITGTFGQAPAQSLFIGFADPQSVLDADKGLTINQLSALSFSMGLVTTRALSTGSHAGTFVLALATDSLNQHPYLDSPWSIPYTIRVSPVHTVHKLLPDVTGVAFTRTPGFSRLTRTLPLVDNLGLATPWRATSSQAWLTVTPSGTTGSGGLTLTADPAGLPADTLSLATVTVVSTDTGVQPVETIQVGLWNGSTTPTVSSFPGSYWETAADPVRPFVYMHHDGSAIDVYNVYTGALAGTIPTTATALGAMAISSDGSTLFAADSGSAHMQVIDLATRTPRTPWNLASTIVAGSALAFIRPNGVGVVLAGDGSAYAAAGGAQLQAGIDTGYGVGGCFAATHDGYTVYTQDTGISPANVTRYHVDVADLNGGTLMTEAVMGKSSIGGASNGFDLAVSGDGARLYSACGSPYLVQSVDPSTLTSLGYLGGSFMFPSNVEVAWDGRVFVGSENTGGIGSVVLVYDAAGNQLLAQPVAGIQRGRLVVSGDGLVAALMDYSGNVTFVPAP